jgi:hypothetical protein
MKQLLFVFWIFPLLLFGSDIPHTGTLIVTYQTNHKGDKLDRVRFWLKNEQGKQTLFPKGSAYANNRDDQTRMVVIEELAPGPYTLEFLVPNFDGKFESVPLRKVKIAKGEVVKINQEIKTRKRYWISKYEKPKKTKANKTDKTVISENEIPESPQIPDQTTTETQQEPPVAVNDTDNESAPTPQLETPALEGKLIISFDLKKQPELAAQVRFQLIDEKGNTTHHPRPGRDTEVPLQTGKMIMVQNLPSGTYELVFYLEGHTDHLLKKTIQIQPNRTKSIHEPLDAHIKNESSSASSENAEEPAEALQDQQGEQQETILSLTANIPTAEFQLIHQESSQLFEGKGREVSFKALPPGIYRIVYSSYDPFFIPPLEETVTLAVNESLKKEVSYITLGKVKILANIHFAVAKITPMMPGNPAYRKDIYGGETTLYLPQGHYRITFNQEKNRKTPEPVDIEVRPLETEQISVYFSAD